MPLRLNFSFAIAALCAVHMHANAASIQPVNDGLQPLYLRINAIEAEEKDLKTTLAGLEPQAEERLVVEEKINVLESEKGRLTGEVLEARKRARSPLVTH